MSKNKGFFALFKTKAERSAYAKWRRDQYNKEHPKLNWKVRADVIYMKNGGVVDYRMQDVAMGSSKHRTKKEALARYNAAVNSEKNNKSYVLNKSGQNKLNERDSGDCSFYEYKLVKINERQK